jgi:hypothetical protein
MQWNCVITPGTLSVGTDKKLRPKRLATDEQINGKERQKRLPNLLYSNGKDG